MEAIGCKLTECEDVKFDHPDFYITKANCASKRDNHGFWSDQFNNPDNTNGHYTFTGREIIEQMGGELHMFCMGAGTGATLNGVCHRFKEGLKHMPKIVLSEPYGSSILYNWVKTRTKVSNGGVSLVEGIGLDYL